MWRQIPWRMVLPALAGVALAAAVGGPLVREMVPGKIPTGDGSDLSAPSGPYVFAHCPTPCQVGAHVNIMAGQTTAPSFVAVYAEAPGHERIWYYPTEAGTQPQVAPRDTVRALSEDFRLSPAHAKANHWELHLLLFEQPTPRDRVSTTPALSHEILQLHLR